MNLKQLVGLGALSLALTFATTGCGIFEPDDADDPYKTDIAGGGDAKLGGPGTGADLSGPGGFGNPGEGPGKNDPFGEVIPGLTLPTVYFAYDQARIGTSETPKLDQIAAYLQQHAGTGVIIEGNCDERGSEEYNRALGERRALAAKDYLASKGIDESRMKTVSYGEDKPADAGHSPEAWAKNRRDEFIGVYLKNK